MASVYGMVSIGSEWGPVICCEQDIKFSGSIKGGEYVVTCRGVLVTNITRSRSDDWIYWCCLQLQSLITAHNR
jgi:hypothetical protein